MAWKNINIAQATPVAIKVFKKTPVKEREFF